MSKAEELKKEEEMGADEARAWVGFYRQQMAAMGANDYEFPAIDEILDDLESGKIKPADAVKKARRILDSKQDYH